MKTNIAFAAALLTFGCAVVPADMTLPPSGTGDMCDAARAQSLVGRPATAALGTEALNLTGARALRWIGPGMAVTMDFSPDRLNIELDGSNRVTAIRCG